MYIKNTVRKLIGEHLHVNLDKLPDDDTIVNPEWKEDTWGLVKLNMTLEDEFNVRIPEHKFEICRTVNDFINLVKECVEINELPR